MKIILPSVFVWCLMLSHSVAADEGETLSGNWKVTSCSMKGVNVREFYRMLILRDSLALIIDYYDAEMMRPRRFGYHACAAEKTGSVWKLDLIISNEGEPNTKVRHNCLAAIRDGKLIVYHGLSTTQPRPKAIPPKAEKDGALWVYEKTDHSLPFKLED